VAARLRQYALAGRLQGHGDPSGLRGGQARAEDATGAPLTFDLPTPPSLNVTRRIDWEGYKKANLWKDRANARLILQKIKPHQVKMTGAFECRILVSEKHRIDFDNTPKVVLDYLRRVELIPDDAPRYLRRLVVEPGDVPEGIRVELTPVEAAAPCIAMSKRRG